MPHRKPSAPFRVLFLCSGEAGLGHMAVHLLDLHGGGRFVGLSSGGGATLDPAALQLLREQGVVLDDAPAPGVAALPADQPIDFAFTLCARCAAVPWPPLPGQPMTAHWPIRDPLAARGGPASRMLAFREAFAEIEQRLRLFASLRIEALTALALQRKLQAIGAGEPVALAA